MIRKPGMGLTVVGLSPQALAKYADPERHTIEAISYQDNHIACVCGWEGEANNDKAFASHNREMRRLAGKDRRGH